MDEIKSEWVYIENYQKRISDKDALNAVYKWQHFTKALAALKDYDKENE